MDTYEIKENYRCNFKTVQPQYSDEESLIYQKSIYQYARQVIEGSNIESVLDVGCGLGLKLQEHILPTGADIVGVDTKETIDLCVARHNFGSWVSEDIENPKADLGRKFDLVISADVIEHLVNPDHLLNFIRRWQADDAEIIISTPERDLRRGTEDMGPPRNRAHVREWNQEEFRNYLTSRGLSVIDHRIVELCEGMSTCQLVSCRF